MALVHREEKNLKTDVLFNFHVSAERFGFHCNPRMHKSNSPFELPSGDTLKVRFESTPSSFFSFFFAVDTLSMLGMNVGGDLTSEASNTQHFKKITLIQEVLKSTFQPKLKFPPFATS